MWPNRVSNPGPLAHESDTIRTGLHCHMAGSLVWVAFTHCKASHYNSLVKSVVLIQNITL